MWLTQNVIYSTWYLIILRDFEYVYLHVVSIVHIVAIRIHHNYYTGFIKNKYCFI